MLSKLYKHEFLGLLRGILPLCGGLLAVATMSKVLLTISEGIDNLVINTMAASLTTVYGLGVFAIFAVGVVMIVMRFYKHLLSGEGYLTFSLPVSPTQHIICKLICAVVMILMTAVTAFASLVIIFLGEVNLWEILKSIPEFLFGLTKEIGAVHVAFYSAEFIALFFAMIVSGILEVYCAIAIGQNFKNRVGGAVLSYIIIHAIVQTVQTFLMLISIAIPGIFEYYDFMTMTHVGLTGTLLWSIGLSTAYFFITRHMLKNKLNLE